MLAQERQTIIIRLLLENHFVKMSDLAERFHISQLTVRRDLDVLQDQRILRRVYGGAILIADPTELQADGIVQYQAAEKQRGADAAKQAIGAMAASMVREGDVVSLLDYGTTALAIAKHLKHKSNLTILTMALPVISELANSKNTIYVLGGALDSNDHYISGPFAEEMLKKFYADVCYMSCSGATLAHGVSSMSVQTSHLGTLAMQQAKKIILVCESRKFSIDAMCLTCPISDMDAIITDDGISDADREAIQNLGIELYIASTKDFQNE